jgi:dTDP-4-amino-4,6-dideoxygalactose transaminase
MTWVDITAPLGGKRSTNDEARQSPPVTFRAPAASGSGKMNSADLPLLPPLTEAPPPLRQPTFVTRPLLPPLAEFIPFLEDIWERRWLTNCGYYHQALEVALAEYLDVPHVSLVANGTMALWLALQAAGVRGEVITTPFTFVATAHAIRLAGARPVFVDVDPDTCNLDPAAVKAAITPETTAILAVHCFGHPCDTKGLSGVAEAHGLKLIFDAAQGFGIRVEGRGLCREGDLSALSFHATKVFNTFEGGAVATRDPAMKQRIDQLRNFGFSGDTIIEAAAMNAKMNEVQAAFGLLQLRHVDAAIARRAAISSRYQAGLAGAPGITVFAHRPEWTLNHGYFPILVDDAHPLGRDGLWQRLEDEMLFARRYFHPLVCDMPGFSDQPSAAAPLPQARQIGRQILCLPLYADLSDEIVDRVVRTVWSEAH